MSNPIGVEVAPVNRVKANGNGNNIWRNGFNVLQLVRNDILTRIDAFRRWFDPRGRKIDEECGHPDVIQIQEYQYKWERGDIARRIISLWPEETWSQLPDIYETEDPEETPFEKAWKELNTQFNLLPILLRGDIISGIGRFGVLVLGIDDGEQLLNPLPGIDLETGEPDDNPEPHKLLYVRPLQEAYVQIHSLQADPTNPRFGQPEVYQLRFLNSILGNQNMISMRAHWTRIIHLCDNRFDSEIFGEPRLKVVFDRVLDLHKLAGGSAEMFWKGGFPGLSMQTQPGLSEEIDLDVNDLKKQIEEYQSGLKRYLATVGMDVKSLSPQVADPEKHGDMQLKMIATAMNVPWRVFVGSEQGKLASSQDSASWNRRLGRRREDYVNPYVIRPFIDRLIHVGVLPKPTENNGQYMIDWEDLSAPSDKEKADVAQARTAALFQYVTGGCDAIVPPFHYLHDILGFDEDEANAILDEAVRQMNQEEPDNPLHPENNPHDPANPTNAPEIPPVGAPTGLGRGVAPFASSGNVPGKGPYGAGNPAPNPKDSGKLKGTRFAPTGASPQVGPGHTGP